MVTSDWQLTVQCLFYTPLAFIFLCPIFVAPCFPLLPVRRLVYWLWQRHLNSISLWQRSWWCLTHSGCWDGKINHMLGGLGRGGRWEWREKENKAVLPAATWPPFPVCARDFFFLSFPSTWEGNPWERARGQTYLGKVSQGKVCARKTSSSSFFGHAKLCQGDRRWTYRGAMLEPARGRSSRAKNLHLNGKSLQHKSICHCLSLQTVHKRHALFLEIFRHSKGHNKDCPPRLPAPTANVVSLAENYY